VPILKVGIMFLRTFGATVKEFVELLRKLDSQEDKLKVKEELKEICVSRGYIVEIEDHNGKFWAKVKISICGNLRRIFVKWDKDHNEIKREKDRLKDLNGFREINSPKLYDSTGNFLLTEWIGGERIDKEDYKRLLLAVDHLLIIQSTDLLKAKLDLDSPLREEYNVENEFTGNLKNIRKVIESGKLGDRNTDNWLRQIKVIERGFKSDLFNAIKKPNEQDFVLSHGDYKPDNLLFVPDGNSLKCHPVDWIYASKRPRWYDIASFTEGCSERQDLEKIYWKKYYDNLPQSVSKDQSENLYCQHRILATLRVASANSELKDGQKIEFSRCLNSLDSLLDKLQ
jgi:thiamine kinase-like enzyme